MENEKSATYEGAAFFFIISAIPLIILGIVLVIRILPHELLNVYIFPFIYVYYCSLAGTVNPLELAFLLFTFQMSYFPLIDPFYNFGSYVYNIFQMSGGYIFTIPSFLVFSGISLSYMSWFYAHNLISIINISVVYILIFVGVSILASIGLFRMKKWGLYGSLIVSILIIIAGGFFLILGVYTFINTADFKVDGSELWGYLVFFIPLLCGLGQLLYFIDELKKDSKKEIGLDEGS